jgi:hypothetical protein
MMRTGATPSASTSRRSTWVARSAESSQLVAYRPETGRMLACPSIEICSGMLARTGAAPSSTWRAVSVRSALPLAKKTSSATRPMIRPRTSIRNRTRSARPMAASFAVISACSASRCATSALAAASTAASTPSFASDVGAAVGERPGASWPSPASPARSTDTGRALVPPVSAPWPPEITDTTGWPKPAASDVRRASYFDWSTWLIAKSTMKRAIRTVIMSE